MKRSDLKKAYDITNPTREQKDRMLDAILAKTPGHYVRRVEFHSQVAKTNRWSWVPAVAMLAVVLALGIFVLGRGSMQRSLSDTSQIESQSLDKVPTESTIQTAKSYDDILRTYNTALRENWTYAACQQSGISAGILENPIMLGYFMLDMDGNAQEELIITDGLKIFDIYTIREDGEVIRIWNTAEHETAMLRKGNILNATYSGERTCDIFYHLTDGFAWIPEKTVLAPTSDVGSSWLAGRTETNAVPISEAEAREIFDAYPNLDFNYTRFNVIDVTSEENPLHPIYANMLGKYVTAIEEDWDPARCQQEGISYMTAYLNSVQEIGYTLTDLDDNGVEELIISDGEVIYDMFVMEEEGILPILSSGERLVFTFGEDHRICFRGSGGAANTEYSIWSFAQDQLKAEHILIYDANADADNPWFYKTHPKETEYPVSEEDANAILELFVKTPIEMRDIIRGGVKDNTEDTVYSALFDTIFMSTAEETIGNDIDAFSASLSQNGYHYYEEEGILYVDDPENPGSYLYGVLTNESGTVEILQLGYCFVSNGETREVHAAFLKDGTKYYLNIPVGKGIEVQEVQHLERLKEFLGLQ